MAIIGSLTKDANGYTGTPGRFNPACSATIWMGTLILIVVRQAS